MFPVAKHARGSHKDDIGLPAKGERTLMQVKAEMADLRERQLRLEYKPLVVEKAYAVAEGVPADAKIQRKGDPQNPGEMKVIDFGVCVLAEHGLAYFVMQHDPAWVMASTTRWLSKPACFSAA